MGFRSWSRSELDYGRKVISSGLEGARSGREAYLNGESFTPFLSESVRDALIPAAVGACIGVLGIYSCKRHKSIGNTLACGIVGSAIGFGGVVAWKTRALIASATSGALKSMGKVCDEHWFEKHPIDYA